MDCAIILAAGEGKRMKSERPKVLCEVLFKPMITWVTDAAQTAGIADICVVIGHKSNEVEQVLDGKYRIAIQTERLGTGHAVMQAADFLKENKDRDVLILCGDAPLIDAATIQNAHALHQKQHNAVTIISAEIDDPTGYGRIIRQENGSIQAIVEQRDASEHIRKIREINSGAYWFNVSALLDVLSSLSTDNSSGEFYLTQAVSLLIEKGLSAGAYSSPAADIVYGANDRCQLLSLNEKARKAILTAKMLDGADIPCTDGVIISPDVTIGTDTVILPGTILKGTVTIGSGCTIGPNTLIENSTVGHNVKLNNVQCYQSTIEDGVTAGPYVHIRPNSHLTQHVKIGDFVEIKNSYVGNGTKIPHLTYVGDSDVGSGVNFGCGCVTVNYDGISKSRCTVGDRVFLGCNTNLIAPVTVGEGAYTAAGSTITDAVPGDALAIARARQINKPEWARQRNSKKEESK